MEKNSRYLCIVCILLLVFALLWTNYGGRRAEQNSADYNSVEGEITHSTELAEQAGAENKSAIQSADRAGEYAEQAIQSNQSAQAIITELRADNQRAKQIVDEIIREAQTRTEKN